MVLTEAFEYFVRRNIWPRIGERFIHALAQPLSDRCYFAIKGTHVRN